MLGLRQAVKTESRTAWAFYPRQMRSIGSVEVKNAFSPVQVARLYDLLIFFDKTTATVLLQ